MVRVGSGEGDPRNSFVSFDRGLWEAAGGEGMVSLPEDLPGLLEEWRS